MKTLKREILIMAFCLCLFSGEIQAQRIMKMGLMADSSASFKYPDSSNFMAKIFFGDTSNLSYFNSDSPDSIVIDKKKKVVKYQRYDGEMVECRITNIREPIEFGLTFQVYELRFRSGMDGRLVLLDLSELEKMVIMEWDYNGYNTGFVAPLDTASAKRLKPLMHPQKSNFLNRIVKN